MAAESSTSPGTRRCSAATSSRRRCGDRARRAALRRDGLRRLPLARRPLQVPPDGDLRGQGSTGSATGTARSSTTGAPILGSWYQVPVLYAWPRPGRVRRDASSSRRRPRRSASDRTAKLEPRRSAQRAVARRMSAVTAHSRASTTTAVTLAGAPAALRWAQADAHPPALADASGRCRGKRVSSSPGCGQPRTAARLRRGSAGRRRTAPRSGSLKRTRDDRVEARRRAATGAAC